MRTLLWCIYYDIAGKNISLEGRHLVLTLLASILLLLANILLTNQISLSDYLYFIGQYVYCNYLFDSL